MGDEDAIDIGQYLRILWRRRQLIVAVTSLAIVAALLVTLLTPPTYETKAVVIVGKSPLLVGAPPDPVNPGLKIGSSLVQDVPVDTLVAFARLPSTIAMVKGRGPGTRMTATAVRNTNLVELRVRGHDPHGIVNIANEWAAVVAEESRTLFASTAQTLGFYEDRLRQTEQTLRAAEDANRNFAATSRIQLLQSRVNALVSQISGYRSRLTDMTIGLERARAEFAQVEAQLQKQPRTLVLRKSLDTDPLLMQTARRETTDLGKVVLQTEELNPVHMSLLQTRANLIVQIRGLETERNQVLAALDRLSPEVDKVRGQLAAEQLAASRLAEAVQTARQVYDVLLQRREEAWVASTASPASVRAVAQALVPESPVGPRKLLTLATAAFLGLLVGSVGAFVADAFLRSKETGREISGVVPVPPPASRTMSP